MSAQVCMIFPHTLESESFVLREAEASYQGLGWAGGERPLALLNVSSARPLLAPACTARLGKRQATTYKWTPCS